ncbi:MAG: hypothetical protein RR441_06435 [Longicatena sp.]
MTFIEETIQKSWDIWSQYVDHPFLKDIRNHTMKQDMFIQYLIEDTKYLKEYARCFGMGIFKSETMDEICLFYEMLKFVESNESAARIRMLKALGYDVKQLEVEPKQETCRNYTNFLHEVAKNEGNIEILYATLPCMLSYAYIGKCLLEENADLIQESVYGDWIQEYCCTEYLEKCKTWMNFANEASQYLKENEKEHLQELFREASIHELKFWNMSYQTKG